jgi:hypothetical protein
MDHFIAKFADQIAGTLSGFDRLVFRGTLRRIAYPFGMQGYLWANQVPLTAFGAHVNEVSERVKQAALRCVQQAGRTVRYLQSSKDDKEEIARAIARQENIEEGPVCALTCVEPCWGFDVYRNRETKKLDLVQRSRKCLYVYQYWQHPALGWLNARIQTWFPFSIQVCMNGRTWLARQMQQAGIQYQQQNNCFAWVADWERGQRLMDTQLQANWPQLLDGIARLLNPIHDEIFHRFPIAYYWSTYQSEWATDIVFAKQEDLRRLYPLLLHHAMTTFRSPDVLRFLGKKLTATGEVSGNTLAEVTSDLKRRQEGVRIKHRYNGNSVKLYDKAYTAWGAVLRTELTMDEPEDFKVYRRPEGDPDAPMAWLRMRKGIADLHRRAEVSHRANQRYLNALAATDDSIRIRELVGPIEKPTTWNGKRVRALHPFGAQDRALLEAISHGEFLINGLRNKDLQPLLYATPAKSVQERKLRSAAVGRRLRLLRAHHLIRKVPGSHRYHLTCLGRRFASAVLAAADATVNSLITKAA